jgi:hypothetical protein
MDKKVRGDPDVPHRHSRKMQYSGMLGEASKAAPVALQFRGHPELGSRRR